MFKSTPENKKRKHSEHFLHHQEPLGSQRADRTYCSICFKGAKYDIQETASLVTESNSEKEAGHVKHMFRTWV